MKTSPLRLPPELVLLSCLTNPSYMLVVTKPPTFCFYEEASLNGYNFRINMFSLIVLHLNMFTSAQ